jgi:hypothetical protein
LFIHPAVLSSTRKFNSNEFTEYSSFSYFNPRQRKLLLCAKAHRIRRQGFCLLAWRNNRRGTGANIGKWEMANNNRQEGGNKDGKGNRQEGMGRQEGGQQRQEGSGRQEGGQRQEGSSGSNRQDGSSGSNRQEGSSGSNREEGGSRR